MQLLLLIKFSSITCELILEIQTRRVFPFSPSHNPHRWIDVILTINQSVGPTTRKIIVRTEKLSRNRQPLWVKEMHGSLQRSTFGDVLRYA
ncbi:hypothetical protein HHK36_020057 [Tetracentron sinense]|uniref:Uncharacterized protein n=1 Tax=Tetracentron sinense TaxID=13715 RepID=A0A835DBA0_TETSI|nr:hypothetical protein HHK36_020057 [Tetracentron sinense]